jgi:hypothetical protein
MDDEYEVCESTTYGDACEKLRNNYHFFCSMYRGIQDVIDINRVVESGLLAAEEICKKNIEYKENGYPTYFDKGEERRLCGSKLYLYDEDCKYLYELYEDIVQESNVFDNNYVKNNKFLYDLIANFSVECQKGKHYLFQDYEERELCDMLVKNCLSRLIAIWKFNEVGFDPCYMGEDEYLEMLEEYDILKDYLNDKNRFIGEKGIDKNSRKIYKNFILSSFDVIEATYKFDFSYKDNLNNKNKVNVKK